MIAIAGRYQGAAGQHSEFELRVTLNPMPARSGTAAAHQDVEALAACKGLFEPEAGKRCEILLARLIRRNFRDPQHLIQLHEIVLFLRAHPQSPRVRKLADQLLFTFGDRIRALGELPWEQSQWFEAGEVSGIAGTGISTAFSYPFARALAERHGSRIQIDWDSYGSPERLGAALARISQLANEDWTVEAHLDWRQWLESLAPKGKCLPWLLDHIDPATYDLLEIPLVWNLGNSTATRSRTRLPYSRIFYHAEPFLKRRDVSIAGAFAKPPIQARRLPIAEARRVFNLILDTSAVRYRELWGFLYPDLSRMDHADLGRGVDLFWFGVPPSSRLPLRAYHCGMFFKNGVPIGYFEGLSLFERMEAGFNLYPTFRDGESAWLYAQVLKFCRQQLGVTCFTIDPYQLGHENEEAVASGAFWFYRKLGFRSTSPALETLVAREESRIAARPNYRTPPTTLRRLAEAHMIFGESAGSPRDWDGFSLRRLLQLASKQDGTSAVGAWTSILARIRGIEVTADQLMQAKRGEDKAAYLRLLQGSPKLRRSIIKLGADPNLSPGLAHSRPEATILM